MSRHDVKDALLNSILSDEISDRHVSSALINKLSNVPNHHKNRKVVSKKTFNINGIELIAKCIVTQKKSKYTPGIWGIVLNNEKEHITITVSDFFTYDGGFDLNDPKYSNEWKMMCMWDNSMCMDVVQMQMTPHVAHQFEKHSIEKLCRSIEDGVIDKSIRIVDINNKLKLHA